MSLETDVTIILKRKGQTDIYITTIPVHGNNFGETLGIIKECQNGAILEKS